MEIPDAAERGAAARYPSPPDTPRGRFVVAAILFLLATVSSLCIRPDYRMMGGGEPMAIAQNLVHEGTFGNPFIVSARTGPTAHLPPLFPAFLALLLWMFPGQPAPVWCVILVHGLHAALLPSVSKLLFGRRAPGLYAAALSIGLPVFALLPTWDAMYTATGLMLFGLFSWWVVNRTRSPLLAGGAAGLFGAALELTNPAVLPVLIGWVLFITAKKYRALKPSRWFAAAFALALMAGCLPWVVRDYRCFHRLVFIRDNLGSVMHSSNNDCAQSSVEANSRSGCAVRTHPIRGRAEAALLVRLGEVDYNRMRLATALDWIATHRSRFLELTRQRIADFWWPPHDWGVRAITVLSLFGLLAMARGSLGPWLFFAGVLAAYPLLYYVLESDVRYRYPILWISLLAAGYLPSAIQRRRL
jgi:hypothetical protein